MSSADSLVDHATSSIAEAAGGMVRTLSDRHELSGAAMASLGRVFPHGFVRSVFLGPILPGTGAVGSRRSPPSGRRVVGGVKPGCPGRGLAARGGRHVSLTRRRSRRP